MELRKWNELGLSCMQRLLAALIDAARAGEDARLAFLLWEVGPEGFDDFDIREGQPCWTALQWAASKGHRGAVAQLLAKGADANVVDYYGRTALYLAADGGHFKVVALLLSTEGLNLDEVTVSGWTALHRATWRGHKAVARLLLAKGADSSLKTQTNTTPLELGFRV